MFNQTTEILSLKCKNVDEIDFRMGPREMEALLKTVDPGTCR